MLALTLGNWAKLMEGVWESAKALEGGVSGWVSCGAVGGRCTRFALRSRGSLGQTCSIGAVVADPVSTVAGRGKDLTFGLREGWLCLV